MRFAALAAVAGFATLGAATQATQDAPQTFHNPNVIYEAILPKEAFWHGGPLNGNVRGFVRASRGPEGRGVKYNVYFENFPQSGGPFIYHIHVKPVPDGGNCTSTLAHLDPYSRGEDPPCQSSRPETCQVGDLSGKYGNITQYAFRETYVDPYTSLIEGTPGFFGNRSLVVHFANKTRITCANFHRVEGCAF